METVEYDVYEIEKTEKALLLLDEQINKPKQLDEFDKALMYKFPDQINEILSK